MNGKSTQDVFSKAIDRADAKGEFLSSAQFDALAKLAKEGHKRLDIVNRISFSAPSIIASAARSLWSEHPQLIAPGGNAYTNRRAAAFIKYMEIILRYITSAILPGDASVLDGHLNGLNETYTALGVPKKSVAVAIYKMKNAAISIANDPNGITPGDCSDLMSELAGYFDRAAAAVDYSESTGYFDRVAAQEDYISLQPAVAVRNDIDKKIISAWISESEEVDTNQVILGKTYILNLQMVDDVPGSIPNSEIDESGLDTEWVVSSSTVELTSINPDMSDIIVRSKQIDSKTLWKANFSLNIPVFGNSKVSQFKITPKVTEKNASILVLIYALGEIYRQFNIQLGVVHPITENQLTVA